MKLSKPLILASESPRRRELLQSLAIPFQVCAPNYEEISEPARIPQAEVKLFAKEKAKSLQSHFPRHFILGSDTLVALGNQKMGKPHDKAEAYEILQTLSGKSHEVFTGVCLLDSETEQCWEEVARTEVKMKLLSPQQIETYVGTGEPLGKAGAYAIQGLGRALIESWKGDFDNVVGLPLGLVKKLLQGK